MSSKKTRDRTPEELAVKKSEFLKICDILDELKINYFLQTGVLLGAVRDQDFIKWDWGVDISVFYDEFINQIDQLAESLVDAGFEIIRINKKDDDLKIYFRGKYPKEVIGYTVFAWNYSESKDVFWRREYSVPSKFLNNLSSIDFFGRQFKCPNNPEEYLTHAYGNWRIPLRTSDKTLYNSNEYYKISFLKQFKEKIKKIYSILKKR